MNEYQVVGRKLANKQSVGEEQLYKMRIFAPNEVVAKSRFFYFLQKMKKVKKATGEIVSCSQVFEKKPMKVKNFGVWIRYDSRSGTHNMYKEYREFSRAEAIKACYQDLAARHRARFRSIHIIKISELTNAQVRRPYIQQLIEPGLKFPLPHRVARSYKPIFAGKRPSTF